MTDTLKPCPFCGGNNLKTGGDDKVVGVWCLTCQSAGPNHYGKHEWNDRAALSRPIDPKAEVGPVSEEFLDRLSEALGRISWYDDNDNRLTVPQMADRLISKVERARAAESREEMARFASPSIVAPVGETDKAFLRDLAVRLQKIPVCMGVDDHDIDRLIDLARSQSAPAEYASGESEAVRIADAVLAWMVKYDLLDGGNEYRAEDVIAVMNDFTPAEKAGVGDEAERVEAMVLSLRDPFPSESLTRSGGIDFWREIMRNALRALSTTKPAQSPFAPDGSWDTRVSDGREEPKQGEIEAAAKFLVDRLKEFERKIDDFDDEREFQGHVVPAIARLSAALAAQGDDAQEGTR